LGEEIARGIVRTVAYAVSNLIEAGFPPLILTSTPARAVLKDLTKADLPRLVVLSQREIPRDTPVEVLGSVIEEEPETVTTYSTSAAMA
jgi:flagellar biosynthesis protein FlhA